MESVNQDNQPELPNYDEPSPPDPWLLSVAEQSLINPYLENCVHLKDVYGWGENHYCNTFYNLIFSSSDGSVTLLGTTPDDVVEIEGNQVTAEKVKEDMKNITLYALDTESPFEWMPASSVTGLKGRFQLDAMRKLKNPEGTLKEVIYKQEV